MIRLKNITKDYKVGNTKIRALDSVNLDFQENEFVCIHGPSGCGKTTLLNILGGLDVATNGEFIFNNINTSKFKGSDWDSFRNQEIGFVFQNYYLLPNLNIYENIELALSLVNVPKEERKLRVNEALESVGLASESKKMPNQLSGGQIQRVAIARAVVNRPSIILADEPTGALDTKNAQVVMDILKSLSKNHTIIMVSHNLELAKSYATRLIEMVDGKIVNDSKTVDYKNEKNEYTKKKTSMSFITSLKLSIKNLLRTKLRTPLTIFAGCIGIIGIGLVLSIANGVNKYIDDVQKSALASFPIKIYSNSKVLDNKGIEKPKLEKFPSGDTINILMGEIRRDYYNAMDEEFITHIENLDKELYSFVNYNRSVNMKIISKHYYREIYGSLFYEMTDDLRFMESQYDKLYGDYPKQYNELALVISEYNSIDASTLSSLNIDFENRTTFSFDEIIGTEYRLIDNDNYYQKIGEKYVKNYNREDLYNNSQTSIKITAILRVKPNISSPIYPTGILYSKSLTDLVLEKANNSEIVKEQLTAGLSKNVFTGLPYEDEVSYSVTYSKMYLYDRTLLELGAIAQTSAINIYTEKFSDRLIIKDYVENYQNPNAKVNIIFNDYMNNLTTEFSELVKVFSTVLIIFSSVSLIVSTIMIGIITYVSVIQRTKEIGLLRSIGARKKDIARLFNVETVIIGFASGLLGILGVFILLKPVNDFVQSMLTEYTGYIRGVNSVIVARFEPLYMFILILGSMVLTLIAGFIPAMLASRKSPIDALRNER